MLRLRFLPKVSWAIWYEFASSKAIKSLTWYRSWLFLLIIIQIVQNSTIDVDIVVIVVLDRLTCTISAIFIKSNLMQWNFIVGFETILSRYILIRFGLSLRSHCCLITDQNFDRGRLDNIIVVSIGDRGRFLKCLLFVALSLLIYLETKILKLVDSRIDIWVGVSRRVELFYVLPLH